MGMICVWVWMDMGRGSRGGDRGRSGQATGMDWVMIFVERQQTVN